MFAKNENSLKKIISKYYKTTAIFVSFFIFVGASFGYYKLSPKIISNENLDSFATIFGISVAIYIAIVQFFHIRNLSYVTEDTREIAVKMGTDRQIRQNSEAFFGVLENNKKYHCYVPCIFKEKPLPLINSGDFAALKVLDKIFEKEKINIHMLFDDSSAQHENEIRKIIYLCSPNTNSILADRYPIERYTENTSEDKEFSTKNFPCWFVTTNETQPLTIRTTYPQTALASPAENSYQKAKKEQPEELYKIFKESTGEQKDYGILARITRDKSKEIIIAGIHQFGTAITADYLYKILLLKESPYSKWVFGSYDFFAIIYGNYDTRSLSVKNTGIHDDCFWYRESQQEIFTRVSQDDLITSN